MLCFTRTGKNFLFEAVVVRVHDVERHLHGVEREFVSEGGLEHLQVNVGALVAGESDVADFALLLRFEHCFHAAAFGKDAIGIGVANDFMKLQKVNVIGLQTAQGFFQLLGGGLFRAAIDLCHEESFLPVTVAQRFAHADLTLAVVVVPAVVEERDAAVESGADDADAFLLVGLHAEVVAAQAYHGNLFARVAQDSSGNGGAIGCVR